MKPFNNGELSKLKSMASIFYQRWFTHFKNNYKKYSLITRKEELLHNFDKVDYYNHYAMAEGVVAVCFKNSVRFSYSVLRTGEVALIEIHDFQYNARFNFNGSTGEKSIIRISRTNNGKSTEVLMRSQFDRWTYMQPLTFNPTVLLGNSGAFYSIV